GVFLPLIRVAKCSGMEAKMRWPPVASVAATWTEAVAAATLLKRPLLITTSATSIGGSEWVTSDDNASAVVWRQGSGVPPAEPGGGKVTSRLATIAPVRTLMNCNVRSALTVPTLAAQSEKCCPGSTGSGGLARRKTTAIFAQPEVPAMASKA